jgi:hypothetical protein
MFGLVYLFAFGFYLLVSALVVQRTMKYARVNGKSAKRWGWSAALAMYLLVFWDWIPTMAVHQYYCATEAGFWIYKTPEQWVKENPGVMEALVGEKGASTARQGDMQNYTDIYFLNQRFNWIVKHNGQFLFNRWRHEQEVVDVKTADVLARYVDFSTSQTRRQAGWSGWKMWLDIRNCRDGKNDEGKIGEFMLKVKHPKENR